MISVQFKKCLDMKIFVWYDGLFTLWSRRRIYAIAENLPAPSFFFLVSVHLKIIFFVKRVSHKKQSCDLIKTAVIVSAMCHFTFYLFFSSWVGFFSILARLRISRMILQKSSIFV